MYSTALDKPLAVGIKQASATGVSIGAVQFIMFSSYAVSLFYGAHRWERVGG